MEENSRQEFPNGEMARLSLDGANLLDVADCNGDHSPAAENALTEVLYEMLVLREPKSSTQNLFTIPPVSTALKRAAW